MNKESKTHVNIYGTGGHSQVVADTIRSEKLKIDLQFDDNAEIVNQSNGRIASGFHIAGKTFSSSNAPFVLAIGNNQIRSQLARDLPVDYVSVTHPKSVIAADVQIGAGSVIFAGAIVQSNCRIGEHVIINTSASVDHDCRIGDFAHISPGATICGNVEIGQGATVGAGATIIQGIKIGQWSTVGAGAVVIRDVPQHVTVAGCPAKELKK